MATGYRMKYSKKYGFKETTLRYLVEVGGRKVNKFGMYLEVISKELIGAINIGGGI